MRSVLCNCIVNVIFLAYGDAFFPFIGHFEQKNISLTEQFAAILTRKVTLVKQ